MYSFIKQEMKLRYMWLEGTGAYGPLLLAPAEGVGALQAPWLVGGIYFIN